ncbi:NAD(P)H-binding protein [Kribbella albertanoniae]|uniref:NAD-dependent epimerase/dehydratase family protein n=1 Tax=Kribbella albertanoniae TaxID=1266829 RepID=A0A4R4PLN9_9ACTN|nr:NAD(P)H-binding protein [Kribbella albertanoniae]TDC23047.1 NAD-dependent epimerase/dehydratase family protein [Kribbella albertanoniae]
MNTQQKFAVTGGTGHLGSHLVDLLESSGHQVVSISRSNGVDLVSGKGLEDALAGVDTVVDAATGASPDKDEATEFFLASAHNLLKAGQQAGVRRILGVSIIGCDRFSGAPGSGGGFGGYYAAKVVQEQALLNGPIPALIVRAAQFHEFVEQFLAWGTQGDTASVPAMRTQLVAARTVAEVLADLAVNPADPGTAFPEVAGPRVERLVDVAQLLAARRGGPAKVNEVSTPDDPDRDLLAGDGLLPGPHAKLAGPSFEEWLTGL